MKPRTLVQSLAAVVAATLFVLVLSSPAQAQPELRAEPTAQDTTAQGDASAALGLPLCTSTTPRNTGGGVFIVVPSTRNYDPDCLIGDGLVGCSNCAAIQALQKSLNDCNSDGPRNMSMDGTWGPLTKAALQAAQRDLGLPPDGIYGPATRNRMRHSYAGECRRYNAPEIQPE